MCPFFSGGVHHLLVAVGLPSFALPVPPTAANLVSKQRGNASSVWATWSPRTSSVRSQPLFPPKQKPPLSRRRNLPLGKIAISIVLFDLLIREGLHFIAREIEDPDRRPIPQQWNAKNGPVSECLLIARRSIFGIGKHVRNVNCSTLQSDSPRTAAAVRLNRAFQRISLRFGRVAVDSANPKNFSITHLDGAAVGRAKPGRRFDQRFKHHL
jgi:hypothetical protein